MLCMRCGLKLLASFTFRCTYLLTKSYLKPVPGIRVIAFGYLVTKTDNAQITDGSCSNLRGCIDDGASIQQLRNDVDMAFFRSKMQRIETVLQTQTTSAFSHHILVTSQTFSHCRHTHHRWLPLHAVFGGITQKVLDEFHNKQSACPTGAEDYAARNTSLTKISTRCRLCTCRTRVKYRHPSILSRDCRSRDPSLTASPHAAALPRYHQSINSSC